MTVRDERSVEQDDESMVYTVQIHQIWGRVMKKAIIRQPRFVVEFWRQTLSPCLEGIINLLQTGLCVRKSSTDDVESVDNPGHNLGQGVKVLKNGDRVYR